MDQKNATPRVALLWCSSFSELRGGTELMGEHISGAFPGAEIITPSDCAHDVLCRLKWPWFSIDKIFQSVAVGRRFFRRHREKPFDAVISQGFMGAYLALRRPEIPAVNTYAMLTRGLIGSGATPPWRDRLNGCIVSFLERLSGCRKDRIVAASRKIQSELKRFYCMDSEPIPLGVDVAMFSPGDKTTARRALGLPESGTIALFVGRPEYAKGYDILLEVAPRFPQLSFVAVFPEPVKGVVNITARSSVTGEQMALYYRAADFMIHPSRYESCLSYTLLQAMASNLPLVANAALFRENLPADVKADDLGIMVERQDADSYSEAVGRFAASPMKVDARAAVLKHFSIEKFMQSWKSLIEKILQEGGRR